MFGEKVNFTFKSEKTYTTPIGAIMSIFCIVLLGSFFMTKIQKFLSQTDPFFSMTNQTLEDNQVVTDLWGLGFFFAIEKVRPEVGNIVATHKSWISGGEKVVTPLELMDCSELFMLQDGILNQDKLAFKRVINLQKRDNKEFLCPVNIDDLLVSGHFGSELFQFVNIELQGCNLREGCFPDDELYKLTFNFLFLTAHPNILGREKDEVIRFNEDTSHYYYLDPTHTHRDNIYFMESTLTLKDNIWDIYEFTEKELQIVEYASTDKRTSWIPPSTPVKERTYVDLFLRQNESVRHYKREEYDILTLLGDLGGLLDIVLLTGVAISSPFVVRLFQAAVVSNNYRIQHYLRDMTPYYDSRKNNGQLTTESD